MPKYAYTALDLRNKKTRGTVDARDDADLRRILRNQELVPIQYRVLEGKQTGYRLKANEVAEFSRQLASMLGSGITLARSMEIVKDRDMKPQLKLIYGKLYADVMQGHTLSEAMARQPRAFPELLVNMYASGEASGQLERVAIKMAVHYEKEHKLNGKVQQAMTYPTILFVLTIAVVMIIFTQILPKFFDLFEGMDLPMITQAVMGISKFLQSYWYWVIIAILILIALFRYFVSIYKVRLIFDRMKLRFPVIGKLLRIIATARFARTLSSLYSSGLSMISALEITSSIVGNKFIEGQFANVIKNIRNGEPLSNSIEAVHGFDKKLSTTILIGEESGRLDTMLESVSESFDYEAEQATTKLVALVEPVMLVVMALIIGSIMIAVMLPMLSLYQNVANM